jgi:deoxyribodipyrimidine photo-lyase
MDGVTRPAIVWFRRDLRLTDHPALAAAIGRQGPVVPLFVLDPRLLAGRWSSPSRNWFLLESLRHLDADLRQAGSRLVVRVGDPAAVVPAVAREVCAAEVIVSRDLSPFGRSRDRRAAAALAGDGIRFRATAGLVIHEPEAVRTASGGGFRVYGAFRRAWAALELRPPIPAPTRLGPVPGALDDLPVPALGELGLAGPTADPAQFPTTGESAARARMSAWLQGGLAAYADRRDRLDLDGTSRLSQDLKFGLVSAAELAWQVAATPPTPGRRAYLDELAWRDFYLHLLWDHPRVLREPFQPAAAAMPWRDAPAELEAWRMGRTGYPIVDAAMRQLVATGTMPNRARMIVASFLAKDLLLDWRAGEAHFMRHLLDGDPAANDGGWQWTASTGADAQPWFRIFNPVRQGERFDPGGEYVRRWLPELRGVPVGRLHAPWSMTRDEQRLAGCRIGVDYPAPIVDHAAARERWLVAARSIRPAATDAMGEARVE